MTLFSHISFSIFSDLFDAHCRSCQLRLVALLVATEQSFMVELHDYSGVSYKRNYGVVQLRRSPATLWQKCRSFGLVLLREWAQGNSDACDGRGAFRMRGAVFHRFLSSCEVRRLSSTPEPVKIAPISKGLTDTY